MNDTWWVRVDQLNSEQEAVVNISRRGNHLVLGPPGSGKTNLLLLRMEFLGRLGMVNSRIVVFTRSLRGFLVSCPTGYRPDPAHVQTLRSWQARTINDLGGRFSTDGTFDHQRQTNADTLLRLVQEQNVGAMFDCLFLDEAQDFLREEIQAFRSVAQQVFAVADGRQQIYGRSPIIDELSAFCEVHALHAHYRNGRKVCHLADAIGRRWSDYQDLYPDSHYPEMDMPSSVNCEVTSNLSEAAEKIVAAIEIQLEAYPGQLIGVLTPKSEDMRALARALKESSIGEFVISQPSGEDGESFELTQDVRVCVCTVHGAKGLEFRAVHFAAIEQCRVHREVQWNVAYTAMTRAKTSLTLYASGGIPDGFQSALNTLQDFEEPDLGDLFQ